MIGLKLKRKIRIPGRGFVSGDIVTDKRTAAYLIAMSAAVEDELIPVEKVDTAVEDELIPVEKVDTAVEDELIPVEKVDTADAGEAVEPIAHIEAVAAVEIVEPPVRKAGRPRKNREAA